MEKNVSSVAEQDKTAEVKKNPKLIELARPYKFDDKEYTICVWQTISWMI